MVPRRLRGSGGSAGSLTLETSLLIALLVLMASATLALLGGSVACLLQKEAGQVAGNGFYATAPAVTASTSLVEPFDGSVSWSSDGVAGPFEVRRYRAGGEGTAGDPASWPVLAVADASPASGLDVQDGDRVVVMADSTRCGTGLQSPAAVTGGGGGGPVPSGPKAAYAGTFWDFTASWDETDHVGVFAEDGTMLWQETASIGTSPVWLYAGTLSQDRLFVYMYPQGGNPGTEGIWAYPDWKDPAADHTPSLVMPITLQDNGGGTIDFASIANSMHVSGDGSTLLFTDNGNGRVLAVDTATLRVTAIAVPDLQANAVFGLDGHAYATDAYGALYRLDSGTPVEVWSDARVQNYTLRSVDAAGNAYFSSVGVDPVPLRRGADGSLTALATTGIAFNGRDVAAFTAAGTPVNIVASAGGDVTNDLQDAVSGSLVHAGLMEDPDPAVAYPENYSFVSVMGSVAIQGGTVLRDGSEPAGTGSDAGDGGSLGSLSSPNGVALSPAEGYAYVADTGNGRVVKFAADGSYVRQFGNTGTLATGLLSQPEGVAVDYGTGDVLVTDTGHDRVVRFSADGTYRGTVAASAGLAAPRAIALARGGFLYVGDRPYDAGAGGTVSRITKLDHNGGAVVSRIDRYSDGTTAMVQGLATGLDGTLWASVKDLSNSYLEHFGSDDAFLGNATPGGAYWNQASGVTVALDGSLWAGAVGFGRLYHVSPTGTVISNSTTFALPRGVAAGLGDEGLYATGGDHLRRYDRNGSVLWER